MSSGLCGKDVSMIGRTLPVDSVTSFMVPFLLLFPAPGRMSLAATHGVRSKGKSAGGGGQGKERKVV